MKYLIISLSVFSFVYFAFYESSSAVIESRTGISELKKKAFQKYFQEGELPEKLTFENEDVFIKSTINQKLQEKVEKLLRRYRSDYSAVVVIDNETGNILATAGYEGRNKKKNYHLPFSTTHPSASLFKIITSATLLEEDKLNPQSMVEYRGRGTTLYKYQLKDKKTRWNRKISLSKAFAFSNNVVFGKAAQENLTGIELFDMAYKLGFNRNVIDGLIDNKSTFQMPEGHYNLAELASGFNKITTMSPVHAAALSMAIVNNGKFKKPTMFQKLIDADHHEIDNTRVSWRAFSEETAKELKSMMTDTVKKGTARGSFRRLPKKLRNALDIGGKTGSLTGGVPFGKRDWFSSYAAPHGKKGISVAVMNVNVKKWYIKSAQLAKEIISFYFTKVDPIDKKNGNLVAHNLNR